MNEVTIKPVIGFTSGDLNGIGIELIIKSLADNRILDICTPVIFASNKSINFYKKIVPESNLQYTIIKDFVKLNTKIVNLISCWEEDVQITPGVLNAIGGTYARKSLQMAVSALKDGSIHGLVTAPIHKNNIQAEDFNYTGHTPYLRDAFGMDDVAMLMVASNMRVAVLTEHIPVKEIAEHVTKKNILRKLKIMQQSLRRDFGIDKPRIAVLALNPHAGDEGLIGKEEIEIIKPSVEEAQQFNMQVYGPYPADAFFARGHYDKFDAVLAMYHDQGLIPFKSLAIGEGINYTAGLKVVRTSPDHGTAFDIAGKGTADHASFLASVYEAVDILQRRAFYDGNRSNPMRKMSGRIVANAVDEKLED